MRVLRGAEKDFADLEAPWPFRRAGGHVVREAHFSVHATRCSCGQAFVVVFMERVDFRDGSDTQVELAVALWPAELEGLEGAFQPLTLTKLVRGRAFVVKSTGDAPRWVASGFSIGPHD